MADSIDELANIVPFTGSLEAGLHDYGEMVFALCMRLQIELEMAATDAQAAINALHGHPLLFGLDSRAKARRIAGRLRRAQNAADGAAREAVKLRAAYADQILSQVK